MKTVDEKIMEVINNGINQSINDVMKKYPNMDGLTIINKVVFQCIDKLATELNWSADRKAKILDNFLDTYNSLKNKK